MSHWAEKYIGEPWVAGVNDCWIFLRLVYREQYGLLLPPVADVSALSALACARAFTQHELRGEWQPVDHPRDGDAALIGKSSRPSHVGICVSGKILHCLRGPGVVLQDRQALANSGLRVLSWHRHQSRCEP